VRRLELPDHRPLLIADTVGFVRRLPHRLVEAFQSTLAEVTEATLLVHVVDGSDPDPTGQMAAVREVLHEIDAATIPELLVFNKSDQFPDNAKTRLGNLFPNGVVISARDGEGLETLLERIADMLELKMITLTLEVPYDRGDVVAAAHRVGEVIEEKYDDAGTILELRVPESAAAGFLEFSK
jgi:GTP-binding protein HflX